MSETAPNFARDDDEIDIAALVATLWKGKWLIALAAVAFLILGAIYAANSQNMYKATALVQLEESKGSIAVQGDLADLFGGRPAATTEIEIIRSRLVIGQAVAQENLDWIARTKRLPILGTLVIQYGLPLPNFGPFAKYGRQGDGISLNFLNVPPEWLEKEITLTAGDGGMYTVALPDGSSLAGTVGQRLQDETRGFALEVASLDGTSGRAYFIMQVSTATAIEAVQERLTTAEKTRQSMILELAYTASTPAEAQRVLAAITKAYVDQNIERSAAQADSGLSFIESQIPEARNRVREAEDALNAYRAQREAIDITFETTSILQQVTQLEEQLNALALEEDQLSQRFTPSHPTYQEFLARKQQTTDRLQQLKAEIGNLPETQQELVNLTRNLELASATYTQMMTRAQEMSVLKASTIGSVRVIDRALADQDAVQPRRSRIVALALLLGLIIGSGIVLVRHWLHNGIQSTAELEALGLPAFASIGVVQKLQRKSLGDTTPLIALTDPNDLAIEALRSLRTSLHFGLIDTDRKSVMFTSSAPGAGKTFTSANLAVVAAQAGQRVCLIDADMRRGQLRKYFGIAKGTPGLADFLSDQISLTEAVKPTQVDGLSVITTGRYPPNPSELLLRNKFDEMLSALEQDFDLIILDAPPVLAVTDPVIMGKLAAMTIMVVRFDQTQPGEVLAVLQALKSGGVKVAGAIINGYDPRKTKAGQGYSYHYRYEYKRRDDE